MRFFIHVMCLSVLLCVLLTGCGGSQNDSVSNTDQSIQKPDPALLTQLQTQLNSILAAQGGKGLSDITGVYVDQLSRDDQGDDAVVSWTYNNTGDYDQNSEVGAADIVTIAQFFGATSSDPNWQQASVADGDANTEVSAADIVPIAQNFQSVVTNYVIEADIDGTGDWHPVFNVAFGEGTLPSGGGKLEFSGTVPYGAQVAGGIAGFRVAAGAEIPAGELYDLSTLQPLEPMVNADNWTKYVITTGDQWGLRSAATLIDGKPAIVYTNADDREIWFARATTANPSSEEDWVVMLIDDNGNMGGPLDIIDMYQHPCIVYMDTVNTDVQFAYSMTTEPNSTADWNLYEVDIFTSGFPSLATCPTTNAITMTFTGGGLGFASFESNVPPTAADTWNSHVFQTGASIFYPELAYMNDVPVVAFRNGEDLFFAVGSQAIPTATSDWTILELTGAQGGTENTGVKLIEGASGLPVIAYRDDESSPNYKLKLAQCTNADWTQLPSWTFITVAERYQAHTGIWPGLGLVNNRIMISYIEAGSAEVSGLHLAYALNETPTGPDDFAVNVVDDPGTYFVTNETNVLVLADGSPALVYRTSEGLKYAYYTAP